MGLFSLTQTNPLTYGSIQSNPWMEPIHVQLPYFSIDNIGHTGPT